MDSDPRPPQPSLETQLSRGLRGHLRDVPVGSTFAVEPSSALCSSLERFLPDVLSARHAEWRSESLDAILVARARRTGAMSAELVGTGILITDQTVTPLWVDLTLGQTSDTVEYIRVRLGEAGVGALGVSGPLCTSTRAHALLASIVDRHSSVAWIYDVEVGPPSGATR